MNLMVEKYGTTRFGKLRFASTAVRDCLDEVASILSVGVPMYVVHDHANNELEVLLISNHFDQLQDDELIPTYFAVLRSNGSVEYERGTFDRIVPESVKDQIMQFIVENSVDMKAFKEYMMSCSRDATDEDFQVYDERFLEALRIYVNRRDKGGL